MSIPFAEIAAAIWRSAKAHAFCGSDPYDGLNSRVLGPLLPYSRALRLMVIQAVKRSPIDLRPVLRIRPGLNPKGLALFLLGATEWRGLGASSQDIAALEDTLVSLASQPDGKPLFGSRAVQPGAAASWAQAYSHDRAPAAGWGYDFPWQARAFLLAAYQPTVVCTSFVVDALSSSQSPAAVAARCSAAQFVLKHLKRHEDSTGVCFSYSPYDRTRVYNASLFAARLLAQAAADLDSNTGELHELAKRAVDYVVARQRADGAWEYGEASHWKWIDNLHTGFNLETIDRVATLLGEDRWDQALHRGLDYYRRHLFHDDGTARYFAHSTTPLDPHTFAQGALTFLRLRRFQNDAHRFSERILERAVTELWDARRAGFRYRKSGPLSSTAIHLRWSQAWMFRALCASLAHRHPDPSILAEEPRAK